MSIEGSNELNTAATNATICHNDFMNIEMHGKGPQTWAKTENVEFIIGHPLKHGTKALTFPKDCS